MDEKDGEVCDIFIHKNGLWQIFSSLWLINKYFYCHGNDSRNSGDMLVSREESETMFL